MDRAAIDHLLTTTRTVRRRLDLSRPVEPEVIQECLEIAIQAPNGKIRTGITSSLSQIRRNVRLSAPSTKSLLRGACATIGRR